MTVSGKSDSTGKSASGFARALQVAQAPFIAGYTALAGSSFDAGEGPSARLRQFFSLILLGLPLLIPVPILFEILPFYTRIIVTFWLAAILFFLASVDRKARGISL